ncbi:hypothetical protein CRYUN_Cryun21dG0073500 [Craigia yunnanensis]
MMNLLSQDPSYVELSDNDSVTLEMISLESVSDEFDDQDDEFDRVELGEARDNLNVISESEPSSGDDME